MSAPEEEDPHSSAATAVAVAPQEESSSAEKLRGTVKWFNSSKGYGFITPREGPGGDEDVFVHQTAIHAQGFRSLQQGEEVEYVAEQGEDGRMRAVEVKGPNGGYVQGAARYGSRGGGGGGGERGGSNTTTAIAAAAPRPSRGLQQGFRFGGVCYTCGLVGHMSRDCRNSPMYYPPPVPPSTRGQGSRGLAPPHLRHPDTRSCYSCGAVGHLQRDCPNFGPA